jgi:hypothetical protein
MRQQQLTLCTRLTIALILVQVVTIVSGIASRNQPALDAAGNPFSVAGTPMMSLIHTLTSFEQTTRVAEVWQTSRTQPLGIEQFDIETDTGSSMNMLPTPAGEPRTGNRFRPAFRLGIPHTVKA